MLADILQLNPPVVIPPQLNDQFRTLRRSPVWPVSHRQLCRQTLWRSCNFSLRSLSCVFSLLTLIITVLPYHSFEDWIIEMVWNKVVHLKHTLPSDVILRRTTLFQPISPLAVPVMRPDSLPRLALYKFLTYLLTYSHQSISITPW